VGRLDDVLQKLSMRASRRAAFLAVAAWGLTLGCTEAPRQETAASAPAAVGEGGSPYTLDSALTLFRVGLDPIAELENAELSMDRAVRRLWEAVQRSDTAALRTIVMNRREFAYLYYPTSPFTRAPSKQEPGLVWFLHLQNSEKGVSRLLARYGGKPLPVVRSECRPPARREGANVIWDDCVQRLVSGTDTVVMRLFGGVYERNGRFKIFSFSNDM
jgi:hypothetical protein